MIPLLVVLAAFGPGRAHAQIAWTAPDSVPSGQDYYVGATAYMSAYAEVTITKNYNAFAYEMWSNGTGAWTNDSGAQTVVYYASAFDWSTYQFYESWHWVTITEAANDPPPPTQYSSLPIDPSDGSHVFAFVPGESSTDTTTRLNNVIQSLTNNHDFEKADGSPWDNNPPAYPKRLKFEAQSYTFWSPQMAWFTNVANLTIQGTGTNSSILHWGTDDVPHSFFLFDKDCATILVTHLVFKGDFVMRSDYGSGAIARGPNGATEDPVPPNQTGGDGSHIKIFGQHITIDYNQFWTAPGFAIKVDKLVPADPTPHEIHIDGNLILGTYADAIHVTVGQSVWIVGNNINGTGDDAIAVYNDDFPTNGVVSSNVHIIYNLIHNSGWNGVEYFSATDGDISHNTITGTGRYGIEVGTFNDASSTSVNENNNSISGAGTVASHHTFMEADWAQYGLLNQAFTSHIPNENVPFPSEDRNFNGLPVTHN